MKFAIISDIHGNLPALNAVLEDAEKQSVDQYIFVGDYCLSNPFPNECITRIRNLTQKYVIRGNEERYLENLVGADQSKWTDGQMQISYWCYQNVSQENKEYLFSLPNRLDITFQNTIILHIAHSSAEFIADEEYRDWNSVKVVEKYKNQIVTSERFREDIKHSFKNNRDFQKTLESLADGIYIFGHSHIQWSYCSDDGRKILINPGACGLPLDGIVNSIPYTILEVSPQGDIEVEERRIPFDMQKYSNLIIKSDQFKKANVWSKVIIKELISSREHLGFFLKHMEGYANTICDEERPYSVTTWEEGYKIWEEMEA